MAVIRDQAGKPSIEALKALIPKAIIDNNSQDTTRTQAKNHIQLEKDIIDTLAALTALNTDNPQEPDPELAVSSLYVNTITDLAVLDTTDEKAYPDKLPVIVGTGTLSGNFYFDRTVSKTAYPQADGADHATTGLAPGSLPSGYGKDLVFPQGGPGGFFRTSHFAANSIRAGMHSYEKISAPAANANPSPEKVYFNAAKTFYPELFYPGMDINIYDDNRLNFLPPVPVARYGKLYVASNGKFFLSTRLSLYKLNADSLATVATYEVPSVTSSFLFETYLYLLSTSASSYSIFDVYTEQIIDTVTLNPSASGNLQADQIFVDSDYVYVLCKTEQTIHRYKKGDNSFVDKSPVAGSYTLVQKVGDRLFFVPNQAPFKTIKSIDLRSMSLSSNQISATTGSLSFKQLLDYNNKLIALDDDALHIINARDGYLEQSIELAQNPTINSSNGKPGMAVSNGILYISAVISNFNVGNSILRIDLTLRRQLPSLPLGQFTNWVPGVILPINNMLVVYNYGNFDGGLLTVDLFTEDIVKYPAVFANLDTPLPLIQGNNIYQLTSTYQPNQPGNISKIEVINNNGKYTLNKSLQLVKSFQQTQTSQGQETVELVKPQVAAAVPAQVSEQLENIETSLQSVNEELNSLPDYNALLQRLQTAETKLTSLEAAPGGVTDLVLQAQNGNWPQRPAYSGVVTWIGFGPMPQGVKIGDIVQLADVAPPTSVSLTAPNSSGVTLNVVWPAGETKGLYTVGTNTVIENSFNIVTGIVSNNMAVPFSGNSVSITGLTAGETYYVSVQTQDAAGNESLPALPASFTTAVNSSFATLFAAFPGQGKWAMKETSGLVAANSGSWSGANLAHHSAGVTPSAAGASYDGIEGRSVASIPATDFGTGTSWLIGFVVDGDNLNASDRILCLSSSTNANARIIFTTTSASTDTLEAGFREDAATGATTMFSNTTFFAANPGKKIVFVKQSGTTQTRWFNGVKTTHTRTYSGPVSINQVIVGAEKFGAGAAQNFALIDAFESLVIASGSAVASDAAIESLIDAFLNP